MQGVSSCTRSVTGVAGVRSVRRSRCAGLSCLRASSEKAPSDIYIGKGKTVKDDPSKYPSKDDLNVVGGWAGGEVGLKNWAAVPVSAVDPALRAALNKYSTPKEAKAGGAASADGDIYIGKGRFISGDKEAAGTDKELGGLTGGYLGGELGLKEGQMLRLKEGTTVRVAGGAAGWKKNALFASAPGVFYAGDEGQVISTKVKNGRIRVAVGIELLGDGRKTVNFWSDELEVIE